MTRELAKLSGLLDGRLTVKAVGRTIARRARHTVRAGLLAAVPSGVAARRTAAALRRRADWSPPDAIEIVAAVSQRLRALGPEGDNADSRWLHYRWLHILDDLFSGIGDVLTPRREFDAVCMGAGTRNPLAFPLLLYLSGARRVWVVEPELDGTAVADWRVRWGLQELALRVLTGDVTSPHFVRAAADVAGFADLRALFFGGGATCLREASVRVVPRYLEDSGIPAGSIHLVTSRSVLEHVTEIDRCVETMTSMLAPGGVMFHQIDLSAHDARDRFAFYYADVTTRERRPDDLNGWRLSDYVKAFTARGLDCRVIDTTVDHAYPLDRSRLRARYRGYGEDDLRCARAVVECVRR